MLKRPLLLCLLAAACATTSIAHAADANASDSARSVTVHGVLVAQWEPAEGKSATSTPMARYRLLPGAESAAYLARQHGRAIEWITVELPPGLLRRVTSPAIASEFAQRRIVGVQAEGLYTLDRWANDERCAGSARARITEADPIRVQPLDAPLAHACQRP